MLPHNDCREEPEIVRLINAQFPRVEDAVQQGLLRFATISPSQRAKGFRIREMAARSSRLGFAVVFDASQT